MKYIKLGNSDLTVSRVCMGCMGFGDAGKGMHSWTLPESASREIVKRGLELGVNFFDTAISYQSGTGEEYLGRILRGLTRREEVVVATKFPPRTPEEIEARVTGQQHVKNMLDTSLQHLDMDYVDLYLVHSWDNNTPIFEIMEGLNDAVKAAVILPYTTQSAIISGVAPRNAATGRMNTTPPTDSAPPKSSVSQIIIEK